MAPVKIIQISDKEGTKVISPEESKHAVVGYNRKVLPFLAIQQYIFLILFPPGIAMADRVQWHERRANRDNDYCQSNRQVRSVTTVIREERIFVRLGPQRVEPEPFDGGGELRLSDVRIGRRQHRFQLRKILIGILDVRLDVKDAFAAGAFSNCHGAFDWLVDVNFLERVEDLLPYLLWYDLLTRFMRRLVSGVLRGVAGRWRSLLCFPLP